MDMPFWGETVQPTTGPFRQKMTNVDAPGCQTYYLWDNSEEAAKWARWRAEENEAVEKTWGQITWDFVGL